RRRAGGGTGEVVVAGVGACDRDPAHGHRLAGTHILVGEGGAGVSRRHGVSGQLVGRQAHSRGRVPVVDLVNTGRAHGEVAWGDVGGGGRGRVDLVVVAGVRARDRDPAYRHRLAIGHVLVRERGDDVGGRHDVATDPVRGQGDGRGCDPVIDLGDA